MYSAEHGAWATLGTVRFCISTYVRAYFTSAPSDQKASEELRPVPAFAITMCTARSWPRPQAREGAGRRRFWAGLGGAPRGAGAVT